jgi:hypothetical protein
LVAYILGTKDPKVLRSNNKISGSSQSIGYLRRRIMRGQLKDLNTVSNNFVRAFALHIIDENGNQTVQYVKRTSK